MATEKMTEAELEERRHQVLLLVQAGASLRAVGRQLGISHMQVKRDLNHVLDQLADTMTQSTARSRALCNTRLERLLAVLWGRALGVGEDRRPDLEAIDRVMRVLDMQSRLLGLARLPQAAGPTGQARGATHRFDEDEGDED